MNSLPLLASSGRISAVSLAVCITVLVLLLITLIGCFWLYFHHYKRTIDNELEDYKIRKEIHRENKKFFANYEKVLLNNTLDKDTKVEIYNQETLVEHIEKKKGARKRAKIGVNIILGFFYVLFAAVIIFSIVTRANNNQIMIGDAYYVVILSGSMEETISSNTYLAERNLTNQIPTFALVSFNKLTSPDQIELYDIVSYYNSKGELIVHRVISIGTNEEGETTYTLRGDANTYSDTYERNMTFDQLDGKFTGFKNFELGLFINYIRSNIGIITVALALILFTVYDVFDEKVNKSLDQRKSVIYPIIDEENVRLLSTARYFYRSTDKNKYRVTYKPLEGFSDEMEMRAEYSSNKDALIMKEITQTHDVGLRRRYRYITNCCFKNGLKGIFVGNRIDFHYCGVVFASITISGSQIILHLKQDINRYQNESFRKYLMVDRDLQYVDIPVKTRIYDDKTSSIGETLIENMMNEIKGVAYRKEEVEKKEIKGVSQPKKITKKAKSQPQKKAKKPRPETKQVKEEPEIVYYKVKQIDIYG